MGGVGLVKLHLLEKILLLISFYHPLIRKIEFESVCLLTVVCIVARGLNSILNEVIEILIKGRFLHAKLRTFHNDSTIQVFFAVHKSTHLTFPPTNPFILIHLLVLHIRSSMNLLVFISFPLLFWKGVYSIRQAGFLGIASKFRL